MAGDERTKPPLDLLQLEDEARWLAGEGRFADAGRLLAEGLVRGGNLPPRARRELTFLAALYLARGGETKLAARYFFGSEAYPGPPPPSLGGQGEAARVARERGRYVEAARLFREAGLPFEAAGCHLAAADLTSGLDALVRVPREHPAYRVACVAAMVFASVLDLASLELENLLAHIIRSGPADAAEVEAFVMLGELYRRKGFADNAAEVLAKVARARPGHERAAALLAGLSAAGTAGPAAIAPGLPDLPDLPPPPRVPTRRMAEPPGPSISSTPTPPRVIPEGQNEALLCPGLTVGGRYLLGERVGRGGMSIVYRATDLELQEPVALKFLIQSLDPGEALERLKRELKLSRQLLHPNIVRLFDLGFFSGLPYISMELLTGRDLSAVMGSGRPLEIATALDYLLEACSALEAAHASGIVHRDIKPSNLFVITTGALKVMDFGIAKLHAAPSVTSTNLVLGTPQYIAPEQITAFSAVTTAADLYSLGVVAFQMLTGTVPFDHRESVPLLMMHLNDEPPHPRERNPAVPDDLGRIVMRLLEKQPAKRPGTARELADALRAVRARY